MKRLLVIALAIAGLLLLPAGSYPQTDQGTATAAPPVAQPLVREGSLAMSLAKALNIGTPQNEADAESLLASVGIAPENGWIADYPVTPFVLGYLQKAVAAASESHRLAMGKEEALKTLQAVADEFGLPIVAAGPGNSSSPYNSENPTVVNNYYYTYGPPVVTYYPPPPDYYYLYAWVPYPFWFGGFFFTGFFCLHDFDRVIVVDHAARICTNHVFDQRTGTVALINPGGRGFETSFRHEAGFASPRARRGALRILNRSLGREHGRLAEPGRVSGGFTEARHGERRFGSAPYGGVRSFSPPVAPERAPSMRFPGSGPGNEFHGGPVSRGESFGGLHGGFSHGSSFGGSEGFNHSRSFGGFHGGDFSHGGSFGGFHGGGFNHRGSFGGFRGGGFSRGGSFGGFHSGSFGHRG